MFDNMFDFNGDGDLDIFEESAKFSFIMGALEDEKPPFCDDDFDDLDSDFDDFDKELDELDHEFDDFDDDFDDDF